MDANQDGNFADSETVTEGDQVVDYRFKITADANNASTDALTIDSFNDPTLNAAGISNQDLFDAALAQYQIDQADNSLTAIVLAPGEMLTFEIHDVMLTLDDGELGEDPHVNTVTVNASDDEGNQVSDDDDATINVDDAPPAINIEKTANPIIINEGGENVTYTFDVTNVSTASTDNELILTSLVDDRGTPSTIDDVNLLTSFVFGSNYGDFYVSGDTDGDFKVDFGETWRFSHSEDVLLNAGDSLTNIATVTGVDDEGTEATDNDDATVTGQDVAPAVNIVKTADPVIVPETGADVTYTYEVTNVSPAPTDSELLITSLIDDNATPGDMGDDIDLLVDGTFVGGDADSDGLLDFGETWTYTFTKNVEGRPWEDPLNTVVVTAEDDEGTEAMDDDTALVDIIPVGQRSLDVEIANKDNSHTDSEGNLYTIATIFDASALPLDVLIDELSATLEARLGRGKDAWVTVATATEFWWDMNNDGVFTADEKLVDLDPMMDGFQTDVVISEPLEFTMIMAKFDATDVDLSLKYRVTMGASLFNQDRPKDTFEARAGVNLDKNSDNSPIAIDLDGDGIETLAYDDTHGAFDLNEDGVPDQSGWLSGDDGFLAVDLNDNGRIDSRAELFGGENLGDGFARLSTYDSNNDGVIDASDENFGELLIWQDANENHQTNPGELYSLSDFDITSLSLDWYNQNGESNGNLLLETSAATLADGSTLELVDVWFAGDSDATESFADLPDLDVADILSDAGTDLETLLADAGAQSGHGQAASYAPDYAGISDVAVGELMNHLDHVLNTDGGDLS